MSGNKNFNKTKENKPEMKTKSHKFDYLKTELKYLDVKVAELFVSDISGACGRGWGEEWSSG